MSIQLEVGTKATVTVPGSSANLGPGFDTLGLAVGIYDTIEVEVTEGGLEVEVYGEGEDDLPRDGSHLVVKAIRSGLNAERRAPGLRVVYQQHPAVPRPGLLRRGGRGRCRRSQRAAGSRWTPTSSCSCPPPSRGTGQRRRLRARLGGRLLDDHPGRRFPAGLQAVAVPVDERIRATARCRTSTPPPGRAPRPAEPRHPHRRAIQRLRTAVMTVALQNHPELLWEGTVTVCTSRTAPTSCR